MTSHTDPLLDRLGIRYPIIQAPMGGGPTTPSLVAAVSNAGGLGFIAAGYLEPDALREQVRDVKRRTAQPFGVNVFIGGATQGAADTAPMLELLRGWATLLGVDAPVAEPVQGAATDALLEVVLEERVPVFSATFGVPDRAAIDALHRAGVPVLGTATTVGEGVLMRDAGADAIIAQGAEAGAHRGTFAGPFEHALIGTLALVPQMVDDVGIPVIASGGIMDGRGIVAARALGAVAVQMGTAFLVCDEAAIPAAWRDRLLNAAADDTAITTAFSGRPARGIRNRFMSEVEESGVPVPPYPLQNDLTRPIRRAAAARGDADALSLWAGQGVRLARAMPAAELVARLVEEIEATTAGLCARPDVAPALRHP